MEVCLVCVMNCRAERGMCKVSALFAKDVELIAL